MPDDHLPAFPILTQKLFGSSRFAALGGFAQGVYVLLLFREWGFRGRGLPEHMLELMRLCNLRPDEWELVRTDVLQFFEARGGRLYNATCEEQLKLALERKAKAVTAAGVRWSGNGGRTAAAGSDEPGKRDTRAYADAYAQRHATQMPSVQVQDDEEPHYPPKPPDGGSGVRPSACGGNFFSVAQKTLGLKRREAGRLQKAHPELTDADLSEWRTLPEKRPDLFAKAKSVEAYLRSLVFRYGTVAKASFGPPPEKPRHQLVEEALARRTAETIAASQRAKAEAEPPPAELLERARRRKLK